MDSIYVDKVLIDTLSDVAEFAFRIKVNNSSNKIINLYTGTGLSTIDTNSGFFIYCKKIKTYYPLMLPYENALAVIPANTSDYKIFAVIGFGSSSVLHDILDTSEILKIKAYHTTKSRAENMRNFLSDIEIVYRVDKSKMDNNEGSLKVPIRNNVIINYFRKDKTLNDVQQTLED